MRFCTSCGSQLDEDARFCTACGKAVQAPEVKEKQSVLVKEPERPERPKGKKGIVAAAAVIAVLLLAGWILTNRHVCDMCGKTFVGTAYYDIWESEDFTLCKACAKSYYEGLPYENYRK